MAATGGPAFSMADDFQHLRHKPPLPLERPRALVIAVPAMQSQVNLARIVRTAGCLAVERVIVGGKGTVDRKIARDAMDHVSVEAHRSLPPVLKRLKEQGFAIVGLEQTTNSVTIYDFGFPRQTVLVVGHERHGITDDILRVLDHVVEIPMHGLPHSLNAATATAMAMYEYCRQFPRG